jgi:hypothetical protein
MEDKRSKKAPKFKLRRQSVQQLGVEELSVVVGGATASCCIGCNTDGTATTCQCPPGGGTGGGPFHDYP